jgi:hypothetical protein
MLLINGFTERKKMPLKSGKSREAISSNIRTEMHSYDRKGKIGTSHPESRKKAQKQAVAIALSKAREKKASQYLAKIATMVAEEAKGIKQANKIIKDDAKASERKYNPNYKFFTLQKMRGC